MRIDDAISRRRA